MIYVTRDPNCPYFIHTRWIAGLRPASLLGLRLPSELGVFARLGHTDTENADILGHMDTETVDILGHTDIENVDILGH